MARPERETSNSLFDMGEIAQDWGFYGRSEPLTELRRIVEAGRWFFCRIEGRRRIGKTTLLAQLARSSDDLSSRLSNYSPA